MKENSWWNLIIIKDFFVFKRILSRHYFSLLGCPRMNSCRERKWNTKKHTKIMFESDPILYWVLLSISFWSTFQSWGWWCTKGKGKVNRFSATILLGWLSAFSFFSLDLSSNPLLSGIIGNDPLVSKEILQGIAPEKEEGKYNFIKTSYDISHIMFLVVHGLATLISTLKRFLMSHAKPSFEPF